MAKGLSLKKTYNIVASRPRKKTTTISRSNVVFISRETAVALNENPSLFQLYTLFYFYWPRWCCTRIQQRFTSIPLLLAHQTHIRDIHRWTLACVSVGESSKTYSWKRAKRALGINEHQLLAYSFSGWLYQSFFLCLLCMWVLPVPWWLCLYVWSITVNFKEVKYSDVLCISEYQMRLNVVGAPDDLVYILKIKSKAKYYFFFKNQNYT